MRPPAAYWLERFDDSGIPVGPVNTIAQILDDAHVKQRQTVINQQREGLGLVPGIRSPIRLQNCPVTKSRAAPQLGDSTWSVLKEIGLSEQQIKSLLKDGVVQGTE